MFAHGMETVTYLSGSNSLRQDLAVATHVLPASLHPSQDEKQVGPAENPVHAPCVHDVTHLHVLGQKNWLMLSQ